jgi:metal-sulfur cluster biosynthetic enzyme
MVSKEEIKEALKKVIDPEIGVSIVDMGLVLGISVDKENNVVVKMTLTTPFCPMARYIVADVEQKVKQVKGVKKVDVILSFPQFRK